MNKAELVREVSDRAGISQKTGNNVVEALMETIIETLSKGEKITLENFGSFQVKQRKAFVGVNPGTGDKIQIPARNVPSFRVSKKFKQKVN